MESLKIKVDVKRRTTENINLQQGYTYPIELTILDNGKEYDCTGATPQIHFAKSNGTFTIKTKDIAIEGNKISFILDSEATNRSGTGKLQAVLTRDGFTFGSWAIFCNIFENVIQDGATEDKNAIDILTELKDEVTKANPLADSLNANIPKAQPLVNSLNTQIPQATEIAREIESIIEEGGAVDKRELGDFKKDFEGVEHDTLNSRLNRDFDNLHQRMNDSSLLAYEGTSIKADNSYYGLQKDTVIKGRTLQNIVKSYKPSAFSFSYPATVSEGVFKLPEGENINHMYIRSQANNHLYKPNTTYTLFVDILENTTGKKLGISNIYSMISSNYERDFKNLTGVSCIKFTTSTDGLSPQGGKPSISIYFGIWEANDTSGEFSKYIKFKYWIIEGDHTQTPLEALPFIEGIESTGESELTDEGYKISGKSCGKNLFDIKKVLATPNGMVKLIEDGFKLTRMSDGPNDTFGAIYEIKLKPNTKYTIKADIETSKQDVRIMMYSYEDKLFGDVSLGNGEFGKWQSAIVTKNGNCLIGIYFACSTVASWDKGDYAIIKNIQLEEATTLDLYEPYKETNYSYILNEPLRSLPNEVCDEIDLTSGVLTRRVGKYTLKGTEHFSIASEVTGNVMCLYSPYTLLKINRAHKLDNIMCDKLPVYNYGRYVDIEGIMSSDTCIVVSFKNISDYNEAIEKIKSNPVTFYYELAEPTTEQLTPQQLKSFDTTTHIISDNKLMPIVSTKIPSDVNAVVQGLKAENKNLEKQLDSAIEELNNTDIDLMAIDWETDYRLCELEWTLLDTMKVETLAENKVVENRILSRYEQAKILIESGKYNKSTMEKQLTMYYNRNYLTKEEFNELMQLMNPTGEVETLEEFDKVENI